jgi:FtsP/CotA-like multicopper oxidase with cupredoxin domain/peroxiredoxin
VARTIMTTQLGFLLLTAAHGPFALYAADRSQPPQSRTVVKAHPRPAPIQLQATLSSARQSKAVFQNPPPANSVDGCYQLTLTSGTFPVANPTSDPTLPQAFELLCYNSNPVGPTIRVKRGATFCVTLTNALMTNSQNKAPTNTLLLFPPSELAEQPHELCTTNLHTHGLHVSPDGNSDNIFQSIKPGQSLPFKYALNGQTPHPAGTFWYHPHHHGSVAYQLSNGLAGALIVEGSADDAWHQSGHYDLEDIDEIKAASTPDHEKILVIQLYNYRIGSDKTARIDASIIYNVQPIGYNCDAIKLDSQDASNTAPTVAQATAINGVLNPTIVMAPGEVQRWRMIHAGWDLARSIEIVDATGMRSTELEFHEIALDGLATGKIEKKCAVDLAPGQRSDVLIRVPPDIPVNTQYFLTQAQVPAEAAPHSDPQAPLFLATISIQGTPQQMQLPKKNDPKFPLCRPFEDIASIATQHTLFFAANDGDQNIPFGTTPYYTIAVDRNLPATFHHQSPLNINIGSKQEWLLVAHKSNHPFHIHVNPFQIVGYQKNSTAPLRPMNVWRDTLYILEGEQYTIRSRFEDFVGDSVLHCHILDHEDQGMMMCLKFRDPQGVLQPVGPGCPQITLKKMSLRAPAFELPDLDGRKKALADFQGRNVVLIFFRGIDCPHCTSQLHDLLQEVRKTKDLDVEIVAVSSEPIVDLGRARKILDWRTSDHLHLFADTRRQAFQGFGCTENSEIRHGAFVIDAVGVIRAGYVGATPYSNPADLVGAVKHQSKNPMRGVTIR